MAKQFEENPEKLAELILYISQKCANDPRFGAVKLNKILFFSDFLSFANYDVPITGMEYQKLKHGPGPRRLLPVRERLVESGSLGIQALPLGSGIQQRTVNLRAPNLEAFTAKEIALIDSVIETLEHRTAKMVSDLSHRMSGWKLALPGETIPYETVFLPEKPAPLSEDAITCGQRIAKELGLLAAT